MTDLQTPGKRIRLLREARGWNQTVLAKHCYVTQQAVASWETDTVIPRMSHRILLAEALGTTRHFLFGEEAA